MSDTLVAIATALGQSSVGIVRLSGPQAVDIASNLVPSSCKEAVKTQNPYTIKPYPLIKAHSLEARDQILLALMRAPHSFTGEDVVEFQTHGNPALLQALVSDCCVLGARLAEPGEFSKRAFLNGKMDLMQAEAIADLIHAQTEGAMRAAYRQLSGESSGYIQSIKNSIEHIRMYLEAELDFAEEDIEFFSSEEFQLRIDESVTRLKALEQQFLRSQWLRQGLTVVLAGVPNAGKSSLFNFILKDFKSIVTNIPGTTRDALEGCLQLQGYPFRFVDTAGLRYTDDEIEKKGMEMTQKHLQKADVLVWLWDLTQDVQMQKQFWLEACKEETPLMLHVLTKKDAVEEEGRDLFKQSIPDEVFLELSTITGEGISLFEEEIVSLFQRGTDRQEHLGMINARQLRHVKSAISVLEHALSLSLEQHQELIVCDLREALEALAAMLGQVFEDNLLDKIFSHFCIGK